MAGHESPKEQAVKKEIAKPNSDQERIQGTWIVESVNAADSLKIASDSFATRVRVRSWPDVKGLAMTFSNDRVEFNAFPGLAKFFNLDATHDPKRIDFTFRSWTSGVRQAMAWQAYDTMRQSIYKFDGDKLVIALGDSELHERPESFDWDKKSPFVQLILRRPTEDERTKLNKAEHSLLQGTWNCVLETVKGERRPIPREKLGDIQLVVKGDRLAFDNPPADALHATFALDLSASPWRIDLKGIADWGTVKKGTTVPGIFFQQGQCLILALGRADRPISFASAGKDRTVYVFVQNRQQPKLGLYWSLPLTGEPLVPEPKNAAPPANKRIRELQKERVDALEEQVRWQSDPLKFPSVSVMQFVQAVRELAEAESDLATTQAGRVAAAKKMLGRLREREEMVKKYQAAGLANTLSAAQIKAARLKAEIELEKLKAAK